jgi:hypothetical protein
MTAAEITKIDLRCPIGPRKLLGRIRSEGGHTPVVQGLMELACRECRSVVEREKGIKPLQVLHCYNLLGELVTSEIIW